MADYEFTLPSYIKRNSKNITLSLNWYRNAHYQSANDAKRKFKKQIEDQFSGLDKISGPISIRFEYYAARNNSPDLDNFTSVVKKFFQDAMVELGFIEDDNVLFITSTSEKYMGVDRDNPRVMAYVREI